MWLELGRLDGTSERVEMLRPGARLRFAIGSLSAHGLPWSICTQRGRRDFYLSVRRGGGVSKYSFHASGDWRLAYVSDYADANGIEDRIVDQWRAPEPDVSGVSLAFVIRTPVEELRPHMNSEISESVTWVSPPLEGASIVGLIIIEPEGTFMLADGQSLIAAMELGDGAAVLVISGQSTIEPAEQEAVEAARSEAQLLAQEQPNSGPSDPHLRITLHGHDSEGGRSSRDVLLDPSLWSPTSGDSPAEIADNGDRL